MERVVIDGGPLSIEQVVAVARRRAEVVVDHSVWGRMVDCCHEVRQQATEGFSRDELLQLKDFCERIRANLNQPSDVACRP